MTPGTDYLTRNWSCGPTLQWVLLIRSRSGVDLVSKIQIVILIGGESGTIGRLSTDPSKSPSEVRVGSLAHYEPIFQRDQLIGGQEWGHRITMNPTFREFYSVGAWVVASAHYGLALQRVTLTQGRSPRGHREPISRPIVLFGFWFSKDKWNRFNESSQNEHNVNVHFLASVKHQSRPFH